MLPKWIWALTADERHRTGGLPKRISNDTIDSLALRTTGGEIGYNACGRYYDTFTGKFISRERFDELSRRYVTKQERSRGARIARLNLTGSLVSPGYADPIQ